MGLLRWISISAVVIAIAIGALGLRLQWANSTPPLPKGMPHAAIWVPAPPAPLDFSPRGYWLACWLDHNRNVNRCKLTDYKGHSNFEEDYSPVGGPNPVPENRLHMKAVDSTNLWAAIGQDFVPVAHLEDGTILVPTRDVEKFRARNVPK